MHWNFQARVLLLHPARYINKPVNYSTLLFHFLHEIIQMHDQSSYWGRFPALLSMLRLQDYEGFEISDFRFRQRFQGFPKISTRSVRDFKEWAAPRSWRPRRSYRCWPLLWRACRGVQLETRPVTLPSTKRLDSARYEHIARPCENVDAHVWLWIFIACRRIKSAPTSMQPGNSSLEETGNKQLPSEQ